MSPGHVQMEKDMSMPCVLANDPLRLYALAPGMMALESVGCWSVSTTLFDL